MTEIIGIDLGLRNDRTVVAWLNDWTLHRLDVMPAPIEYPSVKRHLVQVIPKATRAFIDQNGMGLPIFDELAPLYPQLVGVATTPGMQVRLSNSQKLIIGKGALVNLLAQALNRKKLKIQLPKPERELLRRELTHFERHHIGRGAYRYAAAGSGHDDAVIAVSLALLSKVLERSPS